MYSKASKNSIVENSGAHLVSKIDMKGIFLLFCFLVPTAIGRKGFGPTEQEWGYVTVREGAHMFWWLHETSANVTSYTERPLVIWLQGGPGGSSTGFGNFAELGPLDADLNPRNTTWINDFNVLFVDNPVGCGFSYVDNPDLLVSDNHQIAADFLVLLQGFYEAVPELKNTPLYIFCESFGGTMTAEIAYVLDQAIKNGTLDVNFVGIGLGDSLISAKDLVMAYAPYLFNVGVIDQNGYDQVQKQAEIARDACASGDYINCNTLVSETQGIFSELTANINMYNILIKIPATGKSVRRLVNNPFKPTLGDDEDAKIDTIMNNQVKQALGLNVTWGEQSDLVFLALYDTMMTPVVEYVQLLLNSTNIKVAIYNGQLDLIIATPGTVKWVGELPFSIENNWETISREAMVVENIVEGYYKKVGNLAFYWVDRAGHMVPSDNPAAMKFILEDTINEI